MPNPEPSAARRPASAPASPVRPHAAAPRAAEKSSLDTVGHTSGSVTNGSRPSARARGGRGSSFAPCGHSACRQNWIDTGEVDCVDDEHSGPDLPSAAGHGSIPPDSSPGRVRPTFLVLAWCLAWAVGAALCVAAVCGCYLIAAAIWGPA